MVNICDSEKRQNFGQKIANRSEKRRGFSEQSCLQLEMKYRSEVEDPARAQGEDGRESHSQAHSDHNWTGRASNLTEFMHKIDTNEDLSIFQMFLLKIHHRNYLE